MADLIASLFVFAVLSLQHELDLTNLPFLYSAIPIPQHTLTNIRILSTANIMDKENAFFFIKYCCVTCMNDL